MSNLGKSLEFEGGTVEDAIKNALVTMKVPRERLNIKVVCEERRGLFGMEGASPAKIKVSLRIIKT